MHNKRRLHGKSCIEVIEVQTSDSLNIESPAIYQELPDGREGESQIPGERKSAE